jgi:hypothetical protein
VCVGGNSGADGSLKDLAYNLQLPSKIRHPAKRTAGKNSGGQVRPGETKDKEGFTPVKSAPHFTGHAG